MGKKSKTGEPTTGTGGTSGFKHNPFAALGNVPVATVPTPPTSEPAAKVPEAPPSVAKEAPRKRGRVVLRRETKHRGGKAVIIVTGLSALPDFDVRAAQELAQQLKQQLGCGGTVEERNGEREIVLQGDKPARVAELLRARGFRVDGVTS